MSSAPISLAQALLIKTIDMILISIHPFAFKRLFLLGVAFLCVSSAVCFADSLFMTRHYASDQQRTTSGPFRSTNIRSSLRVAFATASLERNVGCARSQLSSLRPDGYLTSRCVTANRRACILNLPDPWASNRSVVVDAAEESSSFFTIADRATFLF
ncbi:MAG: hypothetical protein QOF24_690 [Verrucomicrobiota bacterium]|jgi:hypothetical protein